MYRNSNGEMIMCPFSGKGMANKHKNEEPETHVEEINTQSVDYWYQRGLNAVSIFEKLSPVTGFIPSSPPLTKLPASHGAWDILADKLPELMKTNTVAQYIDQMPCLSASDLPDNAIYRASVIIGSASHAYAYAENAYCQQTFHLAPSSDKAAERSFPKSLEIPYQELTQRLGRATPQALIYEFSLYNWKFKDDAKDTFELDNLVSCLDGLELLVPIFNNETERRFILCFIMTEILAGPCARLIAEISQCIETNKLDRLQIILLEICDILRRCNLMLASNLPLNEKHRNYVNTPLWTKTVAPLWAAARHGEVGISGGASPFFIMFDNLIGREQYSGNLGEQIKRKEKDNPLSYIHKNFLSSIFQMNLKRFVMQSQNSALQNTFYELCRLYNGDQGYHAIHRGIVLGYMLVGTACGRGNTNSGTLQWHDDHAVMGLDSAFEASKQERDLGIDANERTLRCQLVRAKKQGPNGRELIFDVTDQLFRTYPGDKVSVVPKNHQTRVESLLQQLLQRLQHQDLNALSLGNKWCRFFEFKQIELDLNSPLDVIKKVLTYGNLDEVNLSKNSDIPCVNALINGISPLNPRFYSVCSSQLELEEYGQLRLCVELLEYNNAGKQNYGLCSQYLLGLALGDEVSFSIVRSNWYFPSNPPAPFVAIAGGGGISAVIGILKNRIDAGEKDNVLFFATKNPEFFYFEKEIRTWVEAGDLQLYGVFTRDAQKRLSNFLNEKGNVRQLLWLHSELLKTKIRAGGYLFVCGKIGFGQTVRNVLSELVAQSEIDLTAMMANGIYKEELFTSHQDNAPLSVNEINAVSNQDYFIVDDNIYDISSFKHVHPGGAEALMVSPGSAYKRIHHKCPNIDNILQSLYVGKMASTAVKSVDCQHIVFFELASDLFKLCCESLRRYSCTINVEAEDVNTIMLYELFYMTIAVYLKPVLTLMMQAEQVQSEQEQNVDSLGDLLAYLSVDERYFNAQLENIKSLEGPEIIEAWLTLKFAGMTLLTSAQNLIELCLSDVASYNQQSLADDIRAAVAIYLDKDIMSFGHQ